MERIPDKKFWKDVGGIGSVSRGIGDVQRGIGDVKKLFEPAPMKVKPYNPPSEIKPKRGALAKILLIVKTILLCIQILFQYKTGGIVTSFLTLIATFLSVNGLVAEANAFFTAATVFFVILISKSLYAQLRRRNKL